MQALSSSQMSAIDVMTYNDVYEPLRYSILNIKGSNYHCIITGISKLRPKA